jgi:hypothetical protein
MTMPNWPVENRARTIAALPALGLKLPAAITKAIAAFEAAQEMRVPAPPAPGQPVRLALADTAIDLFAATAERGAKTITLDPAPIARARTAEQEANDLAVLAREVKAAAATGLCGVCDEHYSAVLAALRAAYREHAAALIGHAKLIPPGTNDRAALDAGGALRTAYLAAEKAVAAIRQLQAALFEVADEPTRGPISDRLEQALGFVRTPVVCDALRPMARSRGAATSARSTATSVPPGRSPMSMSGGCRRGARPPTAPTRSSSSGGRPRSRQRRARCAGKIVRAGHRHPRPHARQVVADPVSRPIGVGGGRGLPEPPAPNRRSAAQSYRPTFQQFADVTRATSKGECGLGR